MAMVNTYYRVGDPYMSITCILEPKTPYRGSYVQIANALEMEVLGKNIISGRRVWTSLGDLAFIHYRRLLKFLC